MPSRRRRELFILAIGARDRASSRLRVWDHLDWLKSAGFEVTADSVVPKGAKSFTPAVLARLIRSLPGWAIRTVRADAVVFQETMILWPLLLLRHILRRGPTLFDFSDPVDRHGKGWKGRFRRAIFDLTVSRATSVMVENRAYLTRLGGLTQRLRHFYGPVDAARYGRARAELPEPANAAVIRIGWTGSPGTFHFIAPLLPIIDEIARDHPIEIVLIGAGPVVPALRHAALTLVDWDEETEFATVPTFDLGLFRLEDDEDALWRGAGKLFIYTAAGVPCVASDRGIARDFMAETGVGFPVPDDGQWASVLSHAVADADAAERKRLSDRSLSRAGAISYETYRNTLLALLAPSA